MFGEDFLYRSYQTINPLIYFNDRKSQTELMEMLSKTAQNSYPIDTRHTWAQEPVGFEDALGRIFPVPSEYGWTVSAAPVAFFLALVKSKLFLWLETGGNYLDTIQGRTWTSEKFFFSGEYELFSEKNSLAFCRGRKEFPVIPRMAIIMAFIVGQYPGSERCPRLGCKSRLFVNRSRFWMQGQTW
jgi:hypothetical protein